jgi:tight adherence protein B
VIRFLTSDWIMISLISVCVFFIFYFHSQRVLQILHDQTVGSRTEIVKLLDLMFVEIEEKKITIILFLISFGLGAVFFFLLWPHVVAGLVVGGAVTVLGWRLPLVVVKAMYQSRSGRFTDQMVDGLTIMANGIKSGLSVPQAMERVVDNLPNPISQEFNLVLSQLRLGRSIEESLIELGERIPRPDVQMFVTAINILKETGGNLAETFQTIVYTIRERQKIEKKIQAMTAQGIMQGIIISLVPIVIMIVFLVIDPKYVMPMFNTTLGLIMTFVMFAAIIIGGISIKKIVKINV